MAPPAGTLRVGRYFLALGALTAILYSIVFFGPRQTPKLGIDLVGGVEVRFTAVTPTGGTPSHDDMETARQILSDRVNGTGVTQAEVVIQGNDQLVVSIPGHDAADVQKLGAAAKLNFRGVVAAPVPVTCVSATAKPTGGSSPSASPSTSPSPQQASPSASHSAAADRVRPLAKATTPAKPASTPASAPATSPATAPATSPAASPTAPPSSAAPVKCSASSVSDAAKAGKFAVPLTDTQFNALTSAQQSELNAALSNFDCASAQSEPDLPKSYFIACAPGSEYGVQTDNIAFLLGPVIVPGTQIDSAAAVAPNAQQPAWTVSLTLKGAGSASWANYTSAHNVNGDTSAPSVVQCATTGTACANYVAFTLDGVVVSAPVNENAINGQATQISGNFTSGSAKDLANKLQYGALPLSFKADKAESISATVGSAQLKAGMLAGGIGLILVVIYSLIYYRALGLVTVASLLVSGILTYGALVMLGTQIGFTLTLAGIAGFIVAIGITADSFVVFFERLKDEVHEGRSVRVAVPRAWVRARRTILSADTVSFLAAAVLYFTTTDEVRGFAFTLGLSTILDLIVVFLFTHPLVALLSRSRAFGSARFTGLDALRGTPLPDELPARRTRPTRGAKPADAAPQEETSYAGVAVLDKPSATASPDVDEDLSDEIEPDPTRPTLSDEPEPERPDVDETTRRRSAPEPGSAAERAAARRARMREQRDRKDES